ncbi:MAG: sigma-70 family RNA polymerase sigma factor [Bacteroidetes bacterium]|nr:sigma-70 family RNA polymerase sigma factor [Bacteroidota bacterium]
MQEKEIIDGIIAGNEAAFRELVHRHQSMVVNVCHQFLQDPEDAHDVAQEVFIEVFRSASRFRHQSKISTWLYRIAVNRSLNYLRKKKRHDWIERLDDLIAMKSFAPLEKSPEENREQMESLQVLHQAIGSLPEKQRAAITLSFFEELSYKEIADILKITVSNVGVLINRAKKGVQEKVLRYYGKHYRAL